MLSSKLHNRRVVFNPVMSFAVQGCTVVLSSCSLPSLAATGSAFLTWLVMSSSVGAQHTIAVRPHWHSLQRIKSSKRSAMGAVDWLYPILLYFSVLLSIPGAVQRRVGSGCVPSAKSPAWCSNYPWCNLFAFELTGFFMHGHL